MALPAPTGFDNTADAQVLEMSRAQYLQNVLCDRPGVLRANVSVANLLPTDWFARIDGVGYYYGLSASGDRVLFVSSGRLWEASVTAGTPVPSLGVPTGVPGMPGPFTPGLGVRFVAFGSELIIFQSDGSIPPVRYNGTNLFQLGMDAPAPPVVTQVTPSVPPSKKGTTAAYTYWMTYVDERNRESNPSLPVFITYTAGKCGLIQPPAFPDPQALSANLYEAVPGSVILRRIATFTRTSPPFEDNLTDAQVTDQSPFSDSNNTLANSVPERASVGAVHKNYLFLNDVTRPAILQVSNIGSPTQFSPTSVLATEGGDFVIDSDQGDPVMALVPFGSLLFILKRRGIYLMFGDTVSDFTIRSVHQHGTSAIDSAVRCDNVVMVHSLDGIYLYDYQGVFLSHRVSQEIQAVFDALVKSIGGQAAIEGALGVYVDNKYLLFIGSTAYLYDFRASPAGWTTLSF